MPDGRRRAVMRAVAAVVAAALLAPAVAASPPRAPEAVVVRVGNEVATGFVAGDGRVVTVAHVLERGAKMTVRGRRATPIVAGPSTAIVGGRRATPIVAGPPTAIVGGRRAVVVRADRRLDLAVLAVPGVEGERPRIGHARRTVLALPDGTRAAPTVRRIRARLDGGPRRPALELRADVAAGDSGAPVVTPDGRLAGVVFARSRGRTRTAYAVDATAVARLLDFTAVRP
jgi:Trypsin-like peptidase domain